MNSKEVRYVVATWLDKEKRSSLAEDHLKLFDFLATVNNETLNDLPKIVNIFKEMKEDQEAPRIKTFICSYCGKKFEFSERGYFSYSQGNVCRNCWDVQSKIIERNIKKSEDFQEKEFESKIQKIVNRMLDERHDERGD